MPDHRDGHHSEHGAHDHRGALVAISETNDGCAELHVRTTDGTKQIVASKFAPFVMTSSSAVATAPEVVAAATVTELPGDGLRYLLRARAGTTRTALLNAITAAFGTSPQGSPEFFVPRPHEAYLLDSRARCFSGATNDDVRVGVVHLCVGRDDPSVRADALDDPRNVLVAAGLRVGARREIFVGEPFEIADCLTDRLDELDIDVLVGFGLARVGLDRLDAVLSLGGYGLNLQGRGRSRLAGMSVIDLEHLCRDTDAEVSLDLVELAARRDLPITEVVATALGPRALLDGRANHAVATEAATVAVDVAAELSTRYLPAALHVARTFPVTLAEAAHAGPRLIIERAMLATYHGVHALPIGATGDKEPGGGLIETRARGRFEHVGHIDIASAYATIISHGDIAPRTDPLQAFPALVRQLVKERSVVAAAAATGAGRGEHLQVIERALKRLANAAYGCLGSSHFRFADHRARARVAGICRDAAGAMVDALERHGCQPLKIETDGVYYGANGVSEDDARDFCAAAANASIGASAFTVKSAPTMDVALITPSATITSSGLRKGWSGRRDSGFVRDVREDVIAHLLEGDVAGVVAAIKTAREFVLQGSVQARELAVEHRVVGAPAATAPDTNEVTKDLRVSGGVVDGDRFMVYRTAATATAPGAGATCAAGSTQPYDVAWADARLRRGLAILAPLINLDDVWSGMRPKGIPSETLSAATGAAHTHLVAGIKTAGHRTAEEIAVYSDADAEEAFVAAHGDAHGLVLGYLGDPDVTAPLACRVRTGDFAMEFEHHTDVEAALPAAQAALRELERAGANLSRDVYVVYNGAGSIVLRIRQQALGVTNCVELPDLYRKFASALWTRVAVSLGYGGAPLYDDELYGASATYRLIGVEHERTHGTCSWVASETVLEVASLTELRSKITSATRPPASADVPAVLREWFDEVTDDAPRTTTHDPSSRTPKRESLARRQREKAETRVRLQVLGDPVPPCARTILERIDLGDHIGFGALAKAVFELRSLGWARAELAERLTKGAGGQRRYEPGGRLVFRSGGPDLSDDLWPPDEHNSYHRSCKSSEAKQICEPGTCHRIRSVPTFDPSRSPSFDDARRAAYAAAAKIEVPPAPGINAFKVPPRSGKTVKLAREATRHANAGARVAIFAPSHRALEQVAAYLADPTNGGLVTGVHAVQLLGRGAKFENCPAAFRGRKRCFGCQNDATVQGASGIVKPNPKLATITRHKRQVITREVIHTIADGVCCARSASMKLARGANIVLATHAHLLHENWPAMLGGKAFDIAFVDEADVLFDTLGSQVDHLGIARSRQSAEGVLEGPCEQNCAECRLDFTDRPDVKAWRGTARVAAAETRATPSVLIDALDDALGLLRARPELMPSVDVEKATENLIVLAEALVEPARLNRGKPVPPSEYGARLDAEHRRRPVPGVAVSGLPPSDDHQLVLGVVACLTDAPRDVDDVETRWAHDLLCDPLPADVASRRASLESLAAFIDFTDHAARVGAGKMLLVARVRHETWMKWRPTCSYELQTMDRAAVARVHAYLSKRRTVLVSGTLPEARLLEAVLPGTRLTDHPVDLHDSVTIFLHTTQHAGRADTFTPKAMAHRDVLDLVQLMAVRMKTAGIGRLGIKIRIYARSIKECELLLGLAHQQLKGFEIIDIGKDAMSSKPGNVLELDYLRSPTARAVSVESDVLVVYGSGYPSFDALHGFAETIAETTPDISVDSLAEDGRGRTVEQGMYRTAAEPGRHAVVLVNHMTAADFDPSMRHRIVGADSLYDNIPSGPGVAAEQRVRLAAAVVDSVLPAASVPELEEILKWTASGAVAKPRMRVANQERIDALRQAEKCGDSLQARRPLHGARRAWGLFLKFLAHRGVLVADGNTYTFVPGAWTRLSK